MVRLAQIQSAKKKQTASVSADPQRVVRLTTVMEKTVVSVYHLRAYWCCIWRAGETLCGGLATVRVLGSTMGMALRVR